MTSSPASVPASPTSALPTPAFNDQFEVLRRAYGERLDEKIGGIEAGWQHLLSLPDGAARAEALSNQHRITHSLAGSGATFGFPLVSQFARRAEMVLKEMMGQGQTAGVDGQQQLEIEAAYAGLRAAASELAQNAFGASVLELTPGAPDLAGAARPRGGGNCCAPSRKPRSRRPPSTR